MPNAQWRMAIRSAYTKSWMLIANYSCLIYCNNNSNSICILINSPPFVSVCHRFALASLLAPFCFDCISLALIFHWPLFFLLLVLTFHGDWRWGAGLRLRAQSNANCVSLVRCLTEPVHTVRMESIYVFMQSAINGVNTKRTPYRIRLAIRWIHWNEMNFRTINHWRMNRFVWPAKANASSNSAAEVDHLSSENSYVVMKWRRRDKLWSWPCELWGNTEGARAHTHIGAMSWEIIYDIRWILHIGEKTVTDWLCFHSIHLATGLLSWWKRCTLTCASFDETENMKNWNKQQTHFKFHSVEMVAPITDAEDMASICATAYASRHAILESIFQLFCRQSQGVKERFETSWCKMSTWT